MVGKNIDEEELSREDAADRLDEIADEFDPRIGARERSSILRGSRESVTIKIDWRPG